MRTRVQAAVEHDDVYVRAVTELFRSYAITPIDCNLLLRITARGTPDLAVWYSDPAHYSTETEFPRRVAEAVLLDLDRAQVPVQRPDAEARFAGLDVTLVMPKPATETFENSALHCDFARFESRPLLDVPGRALAAIIVTSGSGPDIGLNAEGRLLGLYTTQVQYGPRIPPRQLRQIVLSTGSGGLAVPGCRLEVAIHSGGMMPTVQTMYQRGTPSNEHHANGLVALLCETTLPRNQPAN